MAFRGFPAEGLEFFEGLEADNSKAYWQDHKAVYEQSVRRPMEELLAALADEFGEGKIFRPYRDVRFSRDKAPYKTNIAATLAEGGYVSLSTEGLGVGAGYYVMEKDQLARYRDSVVDDDTGEELVRLIEEAGRAGIEVTGHDSLKTAPKGYPKDHPRIDLLRQKGLVTWRLWPPAPWLGTRKTADKVAQFFRASRPIVAWLDAHVGPTELVYER